MTNTCAICLAGGKGTRMGTSCPKVLLPINNKPAIYYSLERFDKNPFIDTIVVVCPGESKQEYTALVDDAKLTTNTLIVSGGTSRQESVFNGLNAIKDNCDYVLIHDGARPMLDNTTIQTVLNTAIDKKACVAASKIVNTIKRAPSKKVSETIDRNDVYEIYTPQGFEFSLIYKAYTFVINNDIPITDDASAAEAIGSEVFIADIERKDFKLTTKSDYELVDKLIMSDNTIRIGIGYDVHKFAENRDLILGGINIPYHLGLLGHSDADVLTHAIMDAILGAAGLSDIGQLFPDTSNEFKGIYSIKLLEKVIEKIEEKGYKINNIDTIVTCQMPKINPHRDEMIKCLSSAMKIDNDQINIKATTTEGLGFEGEGLGISARAIAMLNK